MSETSSARSPLQQAAEEVAVASLRLLRALTPDCTALRIVQKSLLRAQAEMLKGVLEVVETQLVHLEQREAPREQGEKIPVE
jgi:hypothetical protein